MSTVNDNDGGFAHYISYPRGFCTNALNEVLHGNSGACRGGGVHKSSSGGWLTTGNDGGGGGAGTGA